MTQHLRDEALIGARVEELRRSATAEAVRAYPLSGNPGRLQGCPS